MSGYRSFLECKIRGKKRIVRAGSAYAVPIVLFKVDGRPNRVKLDFLSLPPARAIQFRVSLVE
jgi:hypothetical protein